MNTLSKRILGTFLVLVMALTACNNGGGGAPAPTSIPAPTSTPANAVVLNFTYGSEKQAWIEAVTKTFQADNPKTSSGKPIIVNLRAIGSGESMDDILNDRDKPALWSPASRLWLPIINDQSNKSMVDANKDCKDLVISPVVIMMWKPMAEALGWPTKQPTWADLVKLAQSAEGWAKYNLTYGPFRFGHTHPDFSNSGFQAIIAMIYAATNKQKDLAIDDVSAKSTQDFMLGIEGAVAHYGRSTGFFGTEMAKRGINYLSAAVVYESVVIQNNIDAQNKKVNLDFPLVAIYPSDGTLLSDHPACILNAAWVTDDQKDAAGVYRDYLLSKDVQKRALQYGFRPADVNIPLTEAVTLANGTKIESPFTLENGVDSTKPNNTFAVPKADVIREIRKTWGQTKRKVNLTLVIDISGSMKNEGRMDGARTGALAFVDQLAADDNLTLIAFDDKQDTLFQNKPVGANRDAIKSAIKNLAPRNGTALWDSIAYAIDRMPLDKSRINAVVVLTDGADNQSKKYVSADILMAKYGMKAENAGTRPDVSIFTIGYSADADAKGLQLVASLGRGAYRDGKPENVRDVFLEISTFF